MTYKNERHRKLFMQEFNKIPNPNKAPHPKYTAALFLLTADTRLWNLIKADFKPKNPRLEHAQLKNIPIEAYTLFKAAKDLCKQEENLTISDLSDTHMISDKIVKIIVTAIFIARNGVGLA